MTCLTGMVAFTRQTLRFSSPPMAPCGCWRAPEKVDNDPRAITLAGEAVPMIFVGVAGGLFDNGLLEAREVAR